MPIAPVAVGGPFVSAARLEGTPGEPGVTLTLSMRQLVHFEVAESTDPPAVSIIFHRGRLADKRIVVDAGHGGHDSGARGTVLREKDVNLDVARQVATRLTALGALTTLTRESDVFVDLYDRPRLANRIGADLFVSIHCNAMPKPETGRGTETYYYRAQQVPGAGADGAVQALTRDNGVRWATSRHPRMQMPAVLVELIHQHRRGQALLARPVRTGGDRDVEGPRRYVRHRQCPVLEMEEMGAVGADVLCRAEGPRCEPSCGPGRGRQAPAPRTATAQARAHAGGGSAGHVQDQRPAALSGVPGLNRLRRAADARRCPAPPAAHAPRRRGAPCRRSPHR